MKKIYTMLAALAIPILGLAAESIPYSTDMTGWKIINENESSNTWGEYTYASDFSGTGWTKGLKYTYDGNYAADDWAISPAITLEAGKEYKVKFWYQTKSNNEDLTLYMAASDTPDALKAGKVVKDFADFKNNAWTRYVEVITPETTGEYYFGFYLHSPKNRWNNTLTGFEVTENKFYPGTVTDLTVIPGENRALEATLSWTLPTVDNDGAPMPEDVVFNSVKVYRDGTLVATLDGNATSWTDNAAQGLKSGFHKYEVEVTVNNFTSARAAVDSRYIGPITAFSIPWNYVTKAMTDDDFTTFFTVVKGENSTTTANWEKKGSSYAGYYIALTPGSGKQEDDWLFCPPVKVEKAGLYRFGIEAKYYTGETQMEIWKGTGASIASMSDKLTTLTSIPNSKNKYYVIFEIDEPGEYTFALHAAATCKSWYSYEIHNFSMEEWYQAPLQATGLTAEVTGENIMLSWTNPAKDNLGKDITTLSKVEVYRDDELLTTLTTGIVPGAVSTCTDTPPTAGSFKYHIIPYMGEHAADGTPVSVQSPWIGDKLQTLPYSYTFNSAVLNGMYTGVDLDNDGFTWNTANGGAPELTFKNMDSDGPVNDRLVSPPLDFTKPGYYKIGVKAGGGASGTILNVGLIGEDNLRANLTDAQSISLNGSMYLSLQNMYFHVPEAGHYCVALDYTVDNIKTTVYELFVSQLNVEYQPVLPGVATELTATPAADGSLSATLEWTNPTTSNLSDVAPILSKAVITRNGEEVATVTEGLVAGEKSTWIDPTIPSAGKHVYTVTIHGPEGASADNAASVTTPWIGGGLEIPYTQDNFNDWTLINVDGDTNTWDDPLSWTLKNDGTRLNMFCTSKPGNDWAISPRLEFVAGKAYDITFTPWLAIGQSEGYTFDLYFGTGDTVDAMTQKLTTVDGLQPNATKLPQTFTVLAVDATEAEGQTDNNETDAFIRVPAGVGTIGFYANKQGECYVSDFSVKENITTGVDSIIGSEDGISIVGGEILFGSEATDVVVADMAGKVIFRLHQANAISLNRFDKGTYIVSAVVGGKRVAMKVVR